MKEPLRLSWAWYGRPTLQRFSCDRTRAVWLRILLEEFWGIPGGATPVLTLGDAAVWTYFEAVTDMREVGALVDRRLKALGFELEYRP